MARSTDILFRVLGKDVSASKTLKGIGQEASRTGDKLRVVGAGLVKGIAGVAAGAAVAGAAAVAVGSKLVSAGEAAATSNARIQQVFSSMGDVSGAAADAAIKYGEALARNTGIETDTIKLAQAKLATFSAVSDEAARMRGTFDRATKAAADLSAAGFGDMASTSVQLGKALQDPLKGITALSRSGVSFTKAEKAKIKALVESGKSFEAQNIILKAVEKQVGGVAEATANDSDKMSVSWEQMTQRLGVTLLPAFHTLTDFVVNNLVPGFEAVAGGVRVFFDALTGNSELNEFDGALRTVNNAGIYFREVWDGVAGFITETVWPAIQNLADAFMKNVWPAIQTVAGIIAENLQPVVTAMADYWTNTLWPAVQKMVPILGTVAKVVGIVVGALAVAVSWIIGKVVPVLLNILGPAVSFVIDVMGKVAGAIEWVIDHFGDLVAYVKTIPDKFKSGLAVLASAITAPFRIAFNGIASLWNNTIGALSFSIPDWVPGIGGNGWDVPDIPMLAKGGIVTRPTLALIGESGPETVVPYDVRKHGGPGGQIVINIHGNAVGPGAGRWLADEIAKAQRSGRGGRVA